MNRPIYILDFEDSFTYNIASEISLLTNHDPTVILKKDTKLFLKNLSNSKTHVILGPGPGHPSEYSDFLPLIKKAFTYENVLLTGICLGHQLLWSAFGAKVVQSKRPVHGQSIEVLFNKFWQDRFFLPQKVSVQRYNSLYVDWNSLSEKLRNETEAVFCSQELMASYCKKFMSFQFHPESIGTTNSKAFFKAILCHNRK